MEPVVLIQARMGSSRLPGKVLLPLGARPVLGHVVDRCRSVSPRVVVATSTEAEDGAIERWCAQEGVSCVRGSRDDVLARFLAALDAHPAEAGVRVTADCPLVDVEVLRAVRDVVARDEADYACAAPPWPLGLPSEGFRVAALREVARRTTGGSPAHAPAREHVTLGLYRPPGGFRVRRLEIPHGFAEPLPRLTLDERDDYALLQAVFARLGARGEPTRVDVAALFARDPSLARINSHVRQNPVPP
jgi:spore coat polysaccharide biosynthesis protein SpsF